MTQPTDKSVHRESRGANALICCAGLTVADKGVTVNATGTYDMDYPSFIEDLGAGDPKVRRQVEAQIPMNRFGKPKEAACSWQL